jgi:hypothetical protein
MKSLQELRNIVGEEKKDYSKFDALVRAGLGNKAQIQRLHNILDKMGEEKPNFNNADKEIIRNVFNKMIDLVTNNPNINRQARRAVSEELEESLIDTSDYKIGPSGKKVKAHRIAIASTTEKAKDQVVEAVEDNVIPPSDPPFVLLLKRRAVRLFPDGTKVALYYNDKLKKVFSVPFNSQYMGYNSMAPVIQAEGMDEQGEMLEEAVMDTLHKIVSNKSAQKVKFASGETRTVDHFTASALTQVHGALNDNNKKKFADMVHKSPGHFTKAADFAFSKSK